jgi:hypothetical protein
VSDSLNYWVNFDEAYAPTLVFELSNGLLGLAWQKREKEIMGTLYTEFILATVVEPSGHVQHYTTYAVPTTLVKRVEPYKWRRESVLSDLFQRLKGLLGGGERNAK